MFKSPTQTELDNISEQLTLFMLSFQLHTYKRAMYKNISRERVSQWKLHYCRLLKYCLLWDWEQRLADFYSNILNKKYKTEDSDRLKPCRPKTSVFLRQQHCHGGIPAKGRDHSFIKIQPYSFTKTHTLP